MHTAAGASDDAVPEHVAAGAGADDGSADGAGEPAEVVLPASVLQRVVALAAEKLGALPTHEVPATLRRVAGFVPSRRARLGGSAIAAALGTEVVFRQQVGELARQRLPGAAAALRRPGSGELDASPVDVAALAYLTRPAGWTDLLAQSVAAVRADASGRTADDRRDQMTRLREQLAAVRASSREQLAAARSELDRIRAENTTLRQRLGAARDSLRRAEDQARQAEQAATAARAESVAATQAAEAEGRRLRNRLEEAEGALSALRRATREDRATGSMYARLLLDYLVEAGQSLRRELALPPAQNRPADLVGVAPGAAGVEDVNSRGLSMDDPSLLDALLRLPQVHLVVDGYNVTKTGYGDLTLEAQRTRLLAAVASLAARTAAEVTVVFDGQDLDGPIRLLQSPRGVRVRFSPGGVPADDVIRELVRAEPQGRPVVVVSSDREVADGVRRAGARPVAAAALVRLLGTR